MPPAPPGSRPDLSGLSCHFEEIPETRGLILSLLVMPVPDYIRSDVNAAIEAIVRLA